MASTRRTSEDSNNQRRPPAISPEARENQLIALAYDAVEQKIRRGEASSQELTHFLKLGSSRERKEQVKMELETELTKQKIASLESAKRIEELYEGAIAAMRSYGGQDPTSLHD